MYLGTLDDGYVYRRSEFIAGLIITNAVGGRKAIASDAMAYLRDLGNQWVDVRADSGHISPGPYLYMSKALRKVYSLRSDTQRAFVTVVAPGSPDK